MSIGLDLQEEGDGYALLVTDLKDFSYRRSVAHAGPIRSAFSGSCSRKTQQTRSGRIGCLVNSRGGNSFEHRFNEREDFANPSGPEQGAGGL